LLSLDKAAREGSVSSYIQAVAWGDIERWGDIEMANRLGGISGEGSGAGPRC